MFSHRFDTLRRAQWSQLSASFDKLSVILLSLRPTQCAKLKRVVHITCLLSFVIAPLSLSAQIPTYVPTSGLVGWWPFNGNANDESGNGNNGTVNGATLTTDRFGVANKAYNFDGTSGSILVADNALLRPSNISISVWVKTDLSPSTGTILSKTNFSNAQGEQYVIDVLNNGVARFHIKRNSACSSGLGWNSLITGSGGISANTWTNIVYTYDGTTMRCYINGLMVHFFNPALGAIDNCAGGTLNIGRYWNGDLKYFKGQIDDLAIYNRALSQQEINTIYAGAVPVTCLPSYIPTNGLVGYWPFCGNANDESGNGNNGTVNGATLTTDRFGVANKAYSFNSNYISVPHNTQFDFETNNSVSVSLWMNPSLVAGSVCVQKQSGVGATQNGFNVGFLNVNSYLAGISQKVPGVMSYASTPSSGLNVNNWYHFVYVFSNGNASLYLNGVLIHTQTDPGSVVGNSTTDLIFGYGLPSNSVYFKGKLDDIAVYKRALTQQEITNLYNGSAPPSITTTASPSIINCGESSTLTASSTSAVQPCIKADLPATLQTGLVGYWPFCGNANDASGNNNNGTVNGATLTTDRFGNASSAYSFDGNDYIDVPDNSSLNNPNISVGLWIKTNSSIYQQVLYKVSLTTAQSEEYSLPINLTATNQVNLDLKNNSCVPGIGWVPFSNNATLNNWAHVSFTHNGSVTKFYLNGVLVNSQVANFNIANCPGGKLLMGISFNLLNGLNGCLDDVFIYNRALLASEVQQLYNLGNVNYSWSTGATTPSITVTPTQTSTYTCTATNAAGSTTSSVSVTVADTLTWTGLYDTDWHKPCNWSPQFVPKCCNNVAVPLTTNQPIVSGIAAAEDLTIYSTNGAQLTVNNGANLQIADCPTTITTTMCPSLAVITTSAVTSVTQITAVSGGTISYQGASAISVRGICWGTSPNPTIANSTTSNGTGIGTFTSNLTGLVAGTTYYVRAYATNGSGTSYGNQVSLVAVNPQPAYASGSVFCTGNPTLVVDVTNPTTGKTWMDRNLGATQVATSSTDAAAYGDLYQWGRGSDGHQCRTSATTTTLSATDQPGHGNFVLAPNSPYDWRSPQNANLWQGVNGVNNPCPSGYRVPSQIELDNERLSWGTNNPAGALVSPLKLPIAGYRDNGSGGLGNVGTYGNYWSSTVSSTLSRSLDFSTSDALLDVNRRAYGFSVRCVKN